MATEEKWADVWEAVARVRQKRGVSVGAAQGTLREGCASGEVRSRHRHEGPDQTAADFWQPTPADFWPNATFAPIWGVSNGQFPEIDGRRVQISVDDLDSWLEHRAPTAPLPAAARAPTAPVAAAPAAPAPADLAPEPASPAAAVPAQAGSDAVAPAPAAPTLPAAPAIAPVDPQPLASVDNGVGTASRAETATAQSGPRRLSPRDIAIWERAQALSPDLSKHGEISKVARKIAKTQEEEFQSVRRSIQRAAAAARRK